MRAPARNRDTMAAPQISRRMEQKEAKGRKERLRCLRFLLFKLPALAASLLLCCGARNAAPPAPSSTQVALDGHVFSLPQGFTIERAAGPPLVDRPIVADLDER